jgi:hypothetical protein
MKRPVFLSASVPDREPFSRHFDPLAIRESIIALAVVTLRERPLVFGGHPAISPLVEHAARSLGALENVYIYQSRFFEGRIPDVAKEFKNLRWTNEEPHNEPTEEESLTAMRLKMMDDWDFAAAVFVGGMEGIFEEAHLFSEFHREKPQLVLGTTGGAAAILMEERRDGWDRATIELLSSERRYRRVFRQLLPET